MGLPFQARTPAWNQETKQVKGQEAKQGKAVRPRAYPALPNSSILLSACFCASLWNYTGILPENISLSGLIQREPKEEEQDDIWMNSGQFTTDEVRPLRYVSLPAPGRDWGSPKECRRVGSTPPNWTEPQNGQQLPGHPFRNNTLTGA